MPNPSEIRNRKAITKHAETVLKKNFPGKSVDTVLSRPLEAAAACLAIAVKTGEVSKIDGESIAEQITLLQMNNPKAVAAMNNAGRAILSSRKRGELKKGQR